MNKIPKLRFPEFSGEWEEKKFQEITKINQGLQIPISERFLENGKNRYFYITNEFLREGSEKKYYIENPPESVLCIEDDILMTRTGNTGQVVTGVNGAFHNNFFKIKYDKTLTDRMFLYYTLTSNKIQNTILKLAGASTIPDLNHGDFYKIKSFYPYLPEQKKIASFLSEVDKSIETLEQEKELWEQYKKGMMQKIFSQKIRFKDENGNDYPEWEEKKLGEIGGFKNGINKSKDDFGFGFPFINLLDVFGKTEIKSNSFELVNATPKELLESNLLKGDVLFIRSSVKPEGVGLTAVISEDLSNTVYSGFLIRFREKENMLNLKFKKYCFYTKKFRESLMAKSSTSANTNINQESLNELKINIPSLPEQEKIADFLSSIDEKIETIVQELESSREFKKGLLQQMFV